MTPADAFTDDELPSERPPAGSLEELEQLHEEPIELEVTESEEVGLDAEGFELGEETGAELVSPLVPGPARFDDDSHSLDVGDDPDEALPEYGWTEGLEPGEGEASDFESLDDLEGLEDGGEDGLPDDDGSLELGELPEAARGADDGGEDGPIEAPQELGADGLA